MLAPANADVPIREQLLKLANDLPFLANAKSKPESVVLAEAKARLRAIEEMGQGEVSPFTRITAEERALGKFDLTYLIDGVLVRDQPAVLVAPKKSLKTNISVDLAIALAPGAWGQSSMMGGWDRPTGAPRKFGIRRALFH